MVIQRVVSAEFVEIAHAAALEEIENNHLENAQRLLAHIHLEEHLRDDSRCLDSHAVSVLRQHATGLAAEVLLLAFLIFSASRSGYY
jgi:S-adenosylmethionine:diacylglycerol 3-amino-3-carboxypropyl transferase